MSTESGKTCGCRIIHDEVLYGDFGHIVLCPLHSGEMAEKLAEALRWIKRHAGPYTEYGESIYREALKALAAYDELQGRKG